MRAILLTFSCLLFCSELWSQLAIDQQVVSITNGAQMIAIGMNLTNEGSVINEGEITLDQDWQNLGNYQSSGTFNLTGKDQSISHGSFSFHQLSILGGGQKRFTSSGLNVKSSLRLIEGKVILDDDQVAYLQETGVVEGGNEDSYIVGKFYRSGEGELYYPIGTEEDFLPITLKDVIIEKDSIGVETIAGEAAIMPGDSLSEISAKRYWEILMTDAASVGGMSLPLLGEDFIESNDRSVIAYSDGIDLFGSLGEVEVEGNTISGTISSDQNILAGLYIIAETKKNQTIDFASIPEKNDRDAPFFLSATATSGLDVVYFSSDERVATVEGNLVTIHGTGTTTITALQEGNVDFLPVEGTRELVVNWILQSVTENIWKEVEIYPIPFLSDFSLVIPDANLYQNYELMIYDLEGRVIVHRILNKGTNEFTITQMRDSPSGIYVLRLNGQNSSATYRIMKSTE